VVLSGYQHEQLFNGLKDAFRSNEEFGRMVKFKLNLNVNEIASGDLQNYVYHAIDWAESQGHLEELVIGARQSNPGNLMLFQAAQELGLAMITPLKRRELQQIIKASERPVDVDIWWKKLASLEYQVCRIEIELNDNRIAYGTGFLIGPDKVITNYHVVEYLIDHEKRKKKKLCWASRENVILRFDYKKIDGKAYENMGKVYHLAGKNWLDNSSPMSLLDLQPVPGKRVSNPNELDFAVLVLDMEAGNEKIGVNENGSVVRGWIPVPEYFPPLPPQSTILILQHPNADPLKIAIGAVIDQNANYTRVKYNTNTDYGSSGSPCFNMNWDLVALHHSGDPISSKEHNPQYNEGVPFKAIRSLWKQSGYSE
jgi:hypothetical protein